jgi:hypothetical protein
MQDITLLMFGSQIRLFMLKILNSNKMLEGRCYSLLTTET